MTRYLKEISTNALYNNGIFYPKGAKPDYKEGGWYDVFNSKMPVRNGESLWYGSYFEREVPNGTGMNCCFLLRKGIYRTVLMNLFEIPELGNITYNWKTQECWVSYFDGTQKELDDTVEGKVPTLLRYINMYGKAGEIKKAYIVTKRHGSDKTISTEPYRMTKDGESGKHTASAYLAFKFASYAFAMADANIYNRYQEIFEAIRDGEVDFENAGIVDSFGEKLTVLENDVIVREVLDGGQSMDLPYGEFEMPSGEDDDTITIGVPANSKAKKKSSKMNVELNINTCVRTKKFFVDYEFVSGEEKLVPTGFDDYILDEETKTCATIIKNMDSLPEVPVMNMLFTGEAGTGKSTAAQIIARVCNLPYRFITMSADTTVADLLLNILPGKKANTFEHFESEFVKAFRNGGVIEIQEVNTVRKPNVLTSLNAALDDLKELHLPNGEIIKRHKNCIVIFTANVGYNGTSDMNQALLSRCFWKAEYKLPKDSVLAARLVEKSGVDPDTATNMVKAMNDVKKVLEENGEINGICSIREITAWAKATKLIGSARIAAENTIVNSSSFDEDIKDMVSQVIANYFA